MGILLSLPQASRSVEAIIAATGLSDSQIAVLLSRELPMPVRPSLVRRWRSGEVPAPGDAVADLLSRLSPDPPIRGEPRAS